MDVHDEEIEESSDNEVVNVSGEYSVTPWQVDGVVDYNKIVQDFGTRLITPEIIEKLQDNVREHPSSVVTWLLLFS